MAYKKYIKRNGKIYGPYVYHSHRVNGKVVSEYYGNGEKKNKITSRKFFYILGGAIFLSVFIFLFFSSFYFTGKSILNLDSLNSDSRLEITLNQGELIPANSIVTIENAGKIYKYKLFELLDEEPVSGNFYLKDSGLVGSGEGFGFSNKIEKTPIVFFKLNVDKKLSGLDNQSLEVDNNQSTEEESQDLNSELLEEKVAEDSNKSKVVEDKLSENDSVSEEEQMSAPITGNIISNIKLSLSNFLTGRVVGKSVVQGDVKKGDEFSYSIPENSDVSIVLNSVKTEDKDLSKEILNLEVSPNEVIVTTNYSIIEEGFGKEFYSNNKKDFFINLSSLGENLVQGDFNIKISYGDIEIVNLNSFINLSSANISETKENVSIENETESIENITSIVSEIEILNLSDEENDILKKEFGIVSVTTKSFDYRDKVIVNFKIGDYVLSSSYDKHYNNDKLLKLMERDKILWLKDLAKEFSSSDYSYKERTDLDIV